MWQGSCFETMRKQTLAGTAGDLLNHHKQLKYYNKSTNMKFYSYTKVYMSGRHVST